MSENRSPTLPATKPTTSGYRKLAAALLLLSPLSLVAQTTEFGTLIVRQNDNLNQSTSITMFRGPGGTLRWEPVWTASSRADFAISFLNDSDFESGALIASVAQNGRNNSAFGDTFGQFYATTSVATFTGIDPPTSYFFATARAAQGTEVNVNLSFAFFPYDQWLGGTGWIESRGNGLPLDRFNGSPGLALGNQLVDIGSGVTILDLRSVDSNATPDKGVLLVNHAKNEDNYASSEARADGAFNIRIRDNGSNGTGTEQDPVTFVYVPVNKVGTNNLLAMGRVNNDATTEATGGTFTVTKGGVGQWYLTIPDQSPFTGTLVISGEGGGTNNTDNIVSYQWEALPPPAIGGRWVIESRDIVSTTALPVLEDGASPGEDMFSFVFFSAPLLPEVIVTAPAEGSVFTSPAAFTVTADASDFGGNVTQVEFFRNGRLIGVDTEAPYSVEESGLDGGRYLYVARATDNEGLAPASTPVAVTVRTDPLNPPPHTALFFDGLTEHVTMGVAPELGVGGPPTKGLTLECWFRKESTGSTASSGSGGIVVQPLFSKGRGESDNSNVDTNYLFGITQDGLLGADFEAYPSPGVAGGANFPVLGTHDRIEEGKWYHAAVTYDGVVGVWKLFLDGVEVGSRTTIPGAMPRYDSIQHFAIGAGMNSTGQRAGSFFGAIDEVRIWDYVRTREEILATKDSSVRSAAGLIGRFGLDEGTGITVASSSGGTVGTAKGPVDGDGLPAPGWQPLWVPGAPLTNEAPVLTLVTPVQGNVFRGTTPILLSAEASDSDGTVAKVSFYDGPTKLTEVTAEPYQFLWTGAAAGVHKIRAVATDDDGAVASQTAEVSVIAPPALLLTELQSSQSVTAPAGVGDYWELTNFSGSPVSLAGYTWHDAGRNRSAALAWALPAGTSIDAGESIIFTAADPALFRAWWGLAGTVRVIQSTGAPGLGQNDAVVLYDNTGAEVFDFSYAPGGFTRSNGLPALGGHAGSSGGGQATAALVWDPNSGSGWPRYTAASIGVNGSLGATTGTDVGSPGGAGGTGVDPSGLLVLEVAPPIFFENAVGPAAIGTLTRYGNVAADLEVLLVSGDVTEATVPASVIIPAGQSSVSFDVSAVNDILADGNQNVLITATAAQVSLAVSAVTVKDDGDVPPPALFLTEIQSSNSGATGAQDYWELTNHGPTMVSLEGFTWDDDSRSHATGLTWALPAGASIAPGESVIFTSADPAAFRSWWGIANTIQVFQSVGSPGLGQDDGIAFFDNTGRELFFVSYAANGFKRPDGSGGLGGHAGVSGGGAATDALVWDVASGVVTPRYVAAEAGTYGAIQAANGTDVGSPGSGAIGTPVNFTLQLLHLADAEAGLLAPQTAPHLAALVDAFDDSYSNTLILAGGDNFIPSPFLNAGADPLLNAVPAIGATALARPDIAIHNLIGVEASAIGNHEWDLGSSVLVDAIRPAGDWVGAQFPLLALNLDYTADAAALSRITDVPLDGLTSAVPEASSAKGRLVPTAVVTKGGEKIGLVAVTTQLLNSLSSPTGTVVKGTTVDNLDLLAAQIQPYVDELIEEGVNKIVLLAHLQQLTQERALAGRLAGVDIILAAGSNTRLGDSNDVAVEFPGHAAEFAGPYPLLAEDKNGTPMLIVNTDNEFTYLGRLVVDFDMEGQVVVEELSNRSTENGAYASTAANVAAAWGVAEADLMTTAFAPGTKGAAVKSVTSAIQAVINAKDGTVYGYTAVYLEGEGSLVRSQETNLGNLTADANQQALRTIVGGSAPIVSLKSGGSILAQIGAVSSAGGSAQKLPPPGNPAVGKLDGGISQLDIENALRLNHALMTFETTPAGLKAILEHGVAIWPNQERFPQVGGIQFAWDPDLPAGSRITSIALLDDDGNVASLLFKAGAGSTGFLPEAPAGIRVVTLNVVANGADDYPVKANGSNFRFVLADGSLGPIIANTGSSFLEAPTLPGNAYGEQAALASLLQSRHGTLAAAFLSADTSMNLDVRIQNLNFRADAVPPSLVADSDGDGISDIDELLLGGDPASRLRVGDAVDLNFGIHAGNGQTLRLFGKLPKGLVFNPLTGRLSGVISGLSGLYDLQVQVLNGSQIAKTFGLRLAIGAFPSRLLAGYEALLEDAMGKPVGMLRLSVTQPGAWSASLDLVGASRRSAKGTFNLVAGKAEARLAMVFKAVRLTPETTVHLTLDAESALVGGDFTDTGAGGGLRGFRLATFGSSPPTTRRMNVAFDAGIQNGVDYPAGFGWARGTVTNRGSVALKGQLGDAQAITLAMKLGVTGQALVWLQPYRNKASYVGGVVPVPNLGQPAPTEEQLVPGAVWFKAKDDREKSYAGGFAQALPVAVLTSGFVPPATSLSLEAALGLTGSVINKEIEGGGLSNAPGATPVLSTAFNLLPNFALTVNAPTTPTPVPWTGKLVKADGAVTGAFTLTAAGQILAGKAVVTGVLLPEAGAGQTIGAGLVKVPVSGAAGAFRTASLLLER